jgi:hypothetical protein
VGLHAKRHGIEITFSGPLDPKAAADVRNYAIKTWTLRRTAEYGSNHYNEHPSPVTSAGLRGDGKTIHVETAGFGPAQCMEIKYFLKGPGGEAVDGVIHNTIHRAGE